MRADNKFECNYGDKTANVLVLSIRASERRARMSGGRGSKKKKGVKMLPRQPSCRSLITSQRKDEMEEEKNDTSDDKSEMVHGERPCPSLHIKAVKVCILHVLQPLEVLHRIRMVSICDRLPRCLVHRPALLQP